MPSNLHMTFLKNKPVTGTIPVTEKFAQKYRDNPNLKGSCLYQK